MSQDEPPEQPVKLSPLISTKLKAKLDAQRQKEHRKTEENECIRLLQEYPPGSRPKDIVARIERWYRAEFRALLSEVAGDGEQNESEGEGGGGGPDAGGARRRRRRPGGDGGAAAIAAALAGGKKKGEDDEGGLRAALLGRATLLQNVPVDAPLYFQGQPPAGYFVVVRGSVGLFAAPPQELQHVNRFRRQRRFARHASPQKEPLRSLRGERPQPGDPEFCRGMLGELLGTVDAKRAGFGELPEGKHGQPCTALALEECCLLRIDPGLHAVLLRGQPHLHPGRWDAVAFLRGCDLFRGAPAAHAADIALKLYPQWVPGGQEVVTRRALIDEVVVVRSGEARIEDLFKDKGKALANHESKVIRNNLTRCFGGSLIGVVELLSGRDTFRYTVKACGYGVEVFKVPVEDFQQRILRFCSREDKDEYMRSEGVRLQWREGGRRLPRGDEARLQTLLAKINRNASEAPAERQVASSLFDVVNMLKSQGGTIQKTDDKEMLIKDNEGGDDDDKFKGEQTRHGWSLLKKLNLKHKVIKNIKTSNAAPDDDISAVEKALLNAKNRKNARAKGGQGKRNSIEFPLPFGKRGSLTLPSFGGRTSPSPSPKNEDKNHESVPTNPMKGKSSGSKGFPRPIHRKEQISRPDYKDTSRSVTKRYLDGNADDDLEQSLVTLTQSLTAEVNVMGNLMDLPKQKVIVSPASRSTAQYLQNLAPRHGSIQSLQSTFQETQDASEFPTIPCSSKKFIPSSRSQSSVQSSRTVKQRPRNAHSYEESPTIDSDSFLRDVVSRKSKDYASTSSRPISSVGGIKGRPQLLVKINEGQTSNSKENHLFLPHWAASLRDQESDDSPNHDLPSKNSFLNQKKRAAGNQFTKVVAPASVEEFHNKQMHHLSQHSQSFDSCYNTCSSDGYNSGTQTSVNEHTSFSLVGTQQGCTPTSSPKAGGKPPPIKSQRRQFTPGMRTLASLTDMELVLKEQPAPASTLPAQGVAVSPLITTRAVSWNSRSGNSAGQRYAVNQNRDSAVATSRGQMSSRSTSGKFGAGTAGSSNPGPHFLSPTSCKKIISTPLQKQYILPLQVTARTTGGIEERGGHTSPPPISPLAAAGIGQRKQRPDCTIGAATTHFLKEQQPLLETIPMVVKNNSRGGSSSGSATMEQQQRKSSLHTTPPGSKDPFLASWAAIPPVIDDH